MCARQNRQDFYWLRFHSGANISECYFIHWMCGQNSCKSSQHIWLSSIKTGHPDTFSIWWGNRKVITHIHLQLYQVWGVMWPITWCITWSNWATHSCVPMLVEVHLVPTRASVAVGTDIWFTIHCRRHSCKLESESDWRFLENTQFSQDGDDFKYSRCAWTNMTDRQRQTCHFS